MLKYIQLKSGYRDNGPAWIARVKVSKSTSKSAYYLAGRTRHSVAFPQKYAVDRAPREVIALIERVMPRLIEGDHPVLAVLREQYRQARISQVEMTGHGFYADFEVPSDVPLTSPGDLAGGRAQIELSGTSYGAGCVLFVRSGRLAFIEGYTYEETWAEDARVLAVGHVQPISPEDTRVSAVSQLRSSSWRVGGGTMRQRALAAYFGFPVLIALGGLVSALAHGPFGIGMFMAYVFGGCLFYSAPHLLWAGVTMFVRFSSLVWHAGFIGCSVALAAIAGLSFFAHDPSGLPLQWMAYWPLAITLQVLLACATAVYGRLRRSG